MKTLFISFAILALTSSFTVSEQPQKISTRQDVSNAKKLDQWTGWLLSGNCWIHGTFTYFGSNPFDWVIFQADSNPYGDNYYGNEPRCMSDEMISTWC